MLEALIIMAAYFFSYFYFFKAASPVAWDTLGGKFLFCLGLTILLPLLHIFLTLVFYFMGENRG